MDNIIYEIKDGFVGVRNCMGSLLAVIEYRDGFDPFGNPFQQDFHRCESCGHCSSWQYPITLGEALKLLRRPQVDICIFPDTHSDADNILEGILQAEKEEDAWWRALEEEEEQQEGPAATNLVAAGDPTVLEILEERLLGHRIMRYDHSGPRSPRSTSQG